MNLFFVIAAFNEEKSIVNVINSLKSHNYYDIVVVDDGSRDKTSELASKEGVVVLRHIINRGQGAALKTGIQFALKNNADIIVTFDADGQHDVDDVDKLIKPVVSGIADVALGSRFLEKMHYSNVPFFRKFFLKGGAFLIWFMYGIKLSDSHNGFRALSRKSAELIDIRSDGMAHASDILEEIKKKSLRFVEVPVNIKYTEYSLSHGQRTMDAFKILYRMIVSKLLR